MDTGVTQEHLLRRLAALLNKTASRRVALEPDYFGFQAASNRVRVGYGLADAGSERRNERLLTQGKQWPSKAKAASNNNKKKRGGR